MKRAILILLALFINAGAQESSQFAPRDVIFYAYPSDAKVAVRLTNTRGGSYSVLGTADGKNPITIPALAFTDSDYKFTFRLEHPHFTFAGKQDAKLMTDNGLSNCYPWERTPIRGTPNSSLIGILYAFRESLAVTAIFATVGTILMIGGFLIWKRHKSNKDYEFKRQSLIAHADMSDPLMNTALGKYLIVDRLGQGGMATVYKGVPADTLDNNEQVAIKVVKKEFAENEEFRDRFKREVQLSKELKHPNIIRVDDWGEQEGLLYMVLEYVDGQTLDDMIPRGGWSLEEAAPYLLHIISGLIVAHERTIVHRDLKPENIMVTKSGQVKIMDFGLARTNRVSSKLTKTGSAMGTPAYISPEQIRGITPIPAMDQYSLGVMMYEIFTGRLPFDVEGLEAMMLAHFSEKPTSPAEWKASLNPVLCQMILRMLEKNAAMRFESLVVVKDGLEHLQAHGTWDIPPFPQARETAPIVKPKVTDIPAVDQNEGTVGFQAPTNDDGTIGFQSSSADEGT